MGDLFDGHAGAITAGKPHGRPARAPVDEVFAAGGPLRDPYHEVGSVIARMSAEDVAARSTRLARAFMDQGVTFDLAGEERPFPLDVLPRSLSDHEWHWWELDPTNSAEVGPGTSRWRGDAITPKFLHSGACTPAATTSRQR